MGYRRAGQPFQHLVAVDATNLPSVSDDGVTVAIAVDEHVLGDATVDGLQTVVGSQVVGGDADLSGTQHIIGGASSRFAYFDNLGANYGVMFDAGGALALGGANAVGGAPTVTSAKFDPNTGDVTLLHGVGFYGTAPIAQPTVVGAKGGNAALTSLLTKLALLGLIVDGST